MKGLGLLLVLAAVAGAVAVALLAGEAVGTRLISG